MSEPKPTLAESANAIAAILSAIVKMSDEVKFACTPLDKQSKLLFMQNSIQKNAAKIVPYVRVVLDAVAAELGNEAVED